MKNKIFTILLAVFLYYAAASIYSMANGYAEMVANHHHVINTIDQF